MLHQLLQSLHHTPGVVSLISRFLALFVIVVIASIGVISAFVNRRMQRWHNNLERIGRKSKSNLDDQYDTRYANLDGAQSKEPLRVKALFVHPIKSCGPVEIDCATITKNGFAYDRTFAVITEAKNIDSPGSTVWRYVTQRTKPQMSLIGIELWVPRRGADAHDPLVQAGGCIIVKIPRPQPANWADCFKAYAETGDYSREPPIRFIVPLLSTAAEAKKHGLQTRVFELQGRDATGFDLGVLPGINACIPKLKAYLKIPSHQNLTIVRWSEDMLVRTTDNLAPLKHIGTPSMHGYTDEQPLHIVNMSSVHAVSTLLPEENQPLNARRFRANIYLAGAPAFAEETWKRCRVLPRVTSATTQARVSAQISVVCRTGRCTMPNVIPEKGTFDQDKPLPGRKKGKPQPSTTLIEYCTPETGNKAALGYMGMHCVPEDSSLEEAQIKGHGLYVEVGDEVEILETGIHLFGATANDY